MPDLRLNLADIFSDMLSDISLELDGDKVATMLVDLASMLDGISLDLDGEIQDSGDLHIVERTLPVGVTMLNDDKVEFSFELDLELPVNLY